MKQCRKCKQELILTDFTKDKRAKDGLSPYCKRCQNRNCLKTRAHKLYGTTIEELDKLERICAICLTPEEVYGTLHVDHCHNRNKFRGLLCRHCNIMLGAAKDNTDTLLAAIYYLEESEKE